MSGAQVRAAEALLRGTGGRTVLVRMPMPAMAGDDGEQLGLETPQFQDVALGPVVFRRSTSPIADTEVLVSAMAVETIVGALAFDSAQVLFAQALGIVVDDALYEVEWVRSSEAFGVVYLYRVGLRGALSELV